MSISIPQLSDVERICNTSVDDAAITIRGCTDPGLLKRALKYEFDNRRRRTLITLLGRRVRQLSKPKENPSHV